MTEFRAAILAVQLQRLPDQLDRKDRAAESLATGIAGIPGLTTIPTVPHSRVTRHARYSFAFDIDPDHYDRVSVATLRAALRAEGIPVAMRGVIACSDEPLSADLSSSNCAPARRVLHHRP